MSDWIQILKDQVDATSAAEVGRKIGYSRPAVSHVYHGRYGAGMGRIRAKVLEVFADGMHCPHIDGPIKPVDCKHMRTAPIPTSNSQKLRHWMACQNCSLNPNAKNKEASHAKT